MMKINKDYLVTDTKKHGGKRKKPVRVLIPHHNAGIATGLDLAKFLKNTTRQLSATYVIGQKGEVYQTLDETLEPYTTGNRAIDTEAITFEIVNSKGAPTWEVTEKAFNSLVQLSTDICKRYGIKEVNFTGDKKGNIHLHKWYQNTNCPGPYLEGRMNEYSQKVNEGLQGAKPVPKPTPKPVEKGKFAIGQDVIVNGTLFTNSNGTKAGNTVKNVKTKVTRYAEGKAKPYNTTGDLGWVAEEQLTAVQSTKEYLQLNKNISSWAVYKLDTPLKAHLKIATLNPKKFGGLEYEVLGRPMTNAITIQTRDYGKVNIYVGPDVSNLFKIVRR